MKHEVVMLKERQENVCVHIVRMIRSKRQVAEKCYDIVKRHGLKGKKVWLWSLQKINAYSLI